VISQELIQRFSEAIARAEGFYTQGSVPQRANNPGDTTDAGDVGNGVIQTGGPNGAKITIFSNVTDGWNELYRKVRRMLSGASEVYTLAMSVEEVGMKYSDDPNWGVNVSAALGTVGALAVTPATTLAEIAQADLQAQGQETIT
jgi:hypothetical protein